MLRGERIGEAADVYSYGVVLWELLCPGQAPWGDHHAMQASFHPAEKGPSELAALVSAVVDCLRFLASLAWGPTDVLWCVSPRRVVGAGGGSGRVQQS